METSPFSFVVDVSCAIATVGSSNAAIVISSCLVFMILLCFLFLIRLEKKAQKNVALTCTRMSRQRCKALEQDVDYSVIGGGGVKFVICFWEKWYGIVTKIAIISEKCKNFKAFASIFLRFREETLYSF